MGDIIHQDGLSVSVEVTISDRIGRITEATHAIKAVLDDFRLNTGRGWH